MTALLLTGIILTALPIILMEAFALAMLFTFTRDDPDAKAVLNVSLAVMAVGILCLIGYFLGGDLLI
ncbi:hypothetical protein D6827_03360 [Candidatus Parcubacteria bacterium]|nr:MAG: hypothetical protein D6827_03360 [Candidatus Parcubacteria bacterium]